jgi:hypothetical protein
MDGQDCDQCGAPLYERRVLRNPVWAVVLGWILLPAGVFLLGLAALLGYWDRSVKAAESDTRARYEHETRVELSALDRPGWGLVDEFDARGAISNATIESLPEPEKTRVREIDRRHGARVAGLELGGGLLALLAAVVLPIGVQLGAPAILLGLYLVSWRRAWRCLECGALA